MTNDAINQSIFPKDRRPKPFRVSTVFFQGRFIKIYPRDNRLYRVIPFRPHQLREAFRIAFIRHPVEICVDHETQQYADCSGPVHYRTHDVLIAARYLIRDNTYNLRGVINRRVNRRKRFNRRFWLLCFLPEDLALCVDRFL